MNAIIFHRPRSRRGYQEVQACGLSSKGSLTITTITSRTLPHSTSRRERWASVRGKKKWECSSARCCVMHSGELKLPLSITLRKQSHGNPQERAIIHTTNYTQKQSLTLVCIGFLDACAFARSDVDVHLTYKWKGTTDFQILQRVLDQWYFSPSLSQWVEHKTRRITGKAEDDLHAEASLGCPRV